MKEITEDPTKWRDCSWIGRLNIIKVSIDYNFNTIFIEPRQDFFVDIQDYSNIYMERCRN